MKERLDAAAICLLICVGTRVRFPGAWRVVSSLRKLLGVRVAGDVEIVRQGLKWFVDPADYIQSDLFWLGRKDTWEIYHLKRLVKPGCVFLDVGANFGYYSIVLAGHLEHQCRCYALEPSPSTYARLSRNVRMNGMTTCVHPVNAGVSSSAGHASVAAVNGNSGANHLQCGGGAIPLVTIDGFCAGKDISGVDVMKVDVEGFEIEVLKGAVRTLDRFRPVLMIEVNPATLRRENKSPDDLLEELRNLKYELFRIRRRRLAPFSGMPPAGDLVNLICKPADRGNVPRH